MRGEKKLIKMNEECAYRRIGNKICVIKQDKDDDILYEFTGDAFQIINCIMNCHCLNKENLLDNLAKIYDFDEKERCMVLDFLGELESEKIVQL